MRKKEQKLTRIKNTGNDGFNNLIDSHTHALEKNSLKIVEALEALSKQHLNITQLKELKSIKAALNRINKGIDKI